MTDKRNRLDRQKYVKRRGVRGLSDSEAVNAIQEFYGDQKRLRELSAMHSHLINSPSPITVRCDQEVLELTEFQKQKFIESLYFECIALQDKLEIYDNPIVPTIKRRKG